MVQTGMLAVALIMTALTASAHTVGENCWGTETPQAKKRIQQLRTQKSVLRLQEDHPYVAIFTALDKFVPEKVEMLYDPNPEFNAYAQNFGGGRVIVMQLGVSTHPLSTLDASAMVACHELGHHFGGTPQVWGMSVEGQSDWYASQDCFKHWVDNSSPIDPQDTEATDFCEKNLGRRDVYCVRTMSASLHLSRIIQDLKKHPMPYLNAKDPAVVPRTVSSHPQAQCRLDTYKAGFDFIESGKSLGENRPFCWFKPEGSAPLSLAGILVN